ncbi:unnamed protein product [Trypanosoma congolense IL3000]|uniref:WGS project CAEQ00000000 data, annotated contig 991 n=1 Tax=Trypanosoma congolense (strain IL3000) TaxID=1068625 RepID=F9WK64_TRYCI|nr:unnamed protein product [Trypanosoma congolense IL3000]
MARNSKHVEVKPSKYRTSLCEHYQRDKECPYGDRCAFAHGEHQLQTEERNMEILRTTGLRRLDRAPFTIKSPSQSILSESLSSVRTPTTRRQPVFISLPTQAGVDSLSVSNIEEEITDVAEMVNDTSKALGIHKNEARPSCSSRFSSSCSTEHPVRYRHNPYSLYAC